MKKTLLALAMLLCLFFAKAQTPQLMNYQAIARDNTGAVLQNAPVAVRFTVHDVNISGVAVYQETQSTTTNQFGLFTLAIGGGTATAGIFDTIKWGSGNKYLQVELDPSGGYMDMGTTQLLSVPYALRAGVADNIPCSVVNATGAVLSNATQFVYITGAYTVTLPAYPATGQEIHIYSDDNNAIIDANGKVVRQAYSDYSGTMPFAQFGTSATHGLTLLYNGTKWFPIAAQ